MNRTRIEWVGGGYTFNPVVGCSHGCSYCYARRMAHRGLWGCDNCKTFTPHLHPERLEEPEKLRKPARIFVCSMGELFDPALPVEDTLAVFDRLDSPANAKHLFLVLTKQPERAHELLYDAPLNYWFGGGDYLPNVWIGASVDGVDPDVTHDRLLALHAGFALNGWHAFISAEPLVGGVRLLPPVYAEGASWLIIGAQTGPGATPPKREWVDSLLEQAEALEMQVFLKDNLLKLFPDLPRLRWVPPLPEVTP